MEFKKVLNNYVVCKCLKGELFNDYLKVGDNGIWLDSSFEPQKHVKTMFEVVAWDKRITTLKKGDFIFTTHTEVCNILGQKITPLEPEFSVRFTTDGDYVYLFVKYSSLFMKFSDGKYSCLNNRSVCTLDLIPTHEFASVILWTDCEIATIVYSENFTPGRKVRFRKRMLVPVNFNLINNQHKEMYFIELNHIIAFYEEDTK